MAVSSEQDTRCPFCGGYGVHAWGCIATPDPSDPLGRRRPEDDKPSSTIQGGRQE